MCVELLAVGTVVGLVGVKAFDGNITLRSDALNINQRVEAAFGSGDVTLVALNPNLAFEIGAKGGLPGLLESELNLISAFNLFIGNASSGNFTVAAPVNITGGVSNLVITTAPSATAAISNALTITGPVAGEPAGSKIASRRNSAQFSVRASCRPAVPGGRRARVRRAAADGADDAGGWARCRRADAATGERAAGAGGKLVAHASQAAPREGVSIESP